MYPKSDGERRQSADLSGSKLTRPWTHKTNRPFWTLAPLYGAASSRPYNFVRNSHPPLRASKSWAFSQERTSTTMVKPLPLGPHKLASRAFGKRLDSFSNMPAASVASNTANSCSDCLPRGRTWLSNPFSAQRLVTRIPTHSPRTFPFLKTRLRDSSSQTRRR